MFETELAIFPVATGTAANGLALAALSPPYGVVYCHETAHILLEECGAPEFYTGGAKLIGLPGTAGKIDGKRVVESLALAAGAGVHHASPAAISLTQATEWGTVYRASEIRALADLARAHGLRVHMDGARLANAIARLGCAPAELTWRAGVDMLSLGATKNGALAAEAVVVFDPALAAGLAERRKRAGHLLSKMRFLSAQLVAMLEHGRWLAYAAHANAMADRLAAGLAAIAGVRLVQPVEANELFLAMPEQLAAALDAEGFAFHGWLDPARRGRAGGAHGHELRHAARGGGRPGRGSDAPRRSRLRVALVDKAGEKRQCGRLAVLTAPGPRAAQAAVLLLQVERDAGLDARRSRGLAVERLGGQALLACQLEAPPDLGRQQPAGLDQIDVVVRPGVAAGRCVRRLAGRGCACGEH